MGLLTRCLGLALPLALQGAEPATKTLQWVQFGAMANPGGLQLKWTGSIRRTFDWRTQKDPWSSLEGGAVLAMTPAFGKAGLFVEWQPLPIAVFRVEGDQLRFTGHYGGVLSFAHGTDRFGESELQARRGDEESGGGKRVSTQATFQYQSGPVVFRAPLALVWTRSSGRGPWFYDPQYDTLLRDGDQLRDLQLQVGWVWTSPSNSLTCGPAIQTQSSREANLERRRAGLFAYLTKPKPLGPFHDPYLAIQIGRDLRDPNRTGQTYLEWVMGGRLGR
jgi:hypothetical protein